MRIATPMWGTRFNNCLDSQSEKNLLVVCCAKYKGWTDKKESSSHLDKLWTVKICTGRVESAASEQEPCSAL